MWIDDTDPEADDGSWSSEDDEELWRMFDEDRKTPALSLAILSQSSIAPQRESCD